MYTHTHTHFAWKGHPETNVSICKTWSPEVLISDNESQFTSETFLVVAKDFDFDHHCSSLHYPQRGGESNAEFKKTSAKHQWTYIKHSWHIVQHCLHLNYLQQNF